MISQYAFAAQVESRICRGLACRRNLASSARSITSSLAASQSGRTSPGSAFCARRPASQICQFGLESIQLSGGVGSFEPGMVRGTQLPPAAMKGFIDVATQLDRATIALHNNGKARAAVIVYLALQHVLFLIFMLT